MLICNPKSITACWVFSGILVVSDEETNYPVSQLLRFETGNINSTDGHGEF